MTTVASRLKELSGMSNATAAAMLLAIGSGTTMAQCLVSYSGLPTGTAAEHLLVDRATGSSEWLIRARRRGRR